MTSASRRRRRAAGLLTAATSAGLLLAGCGTGDQLSDAAASSSVPAAAPVSDGAGRAGDLTAALLPAAAFGAGAQVTPLTRAQLDQGAGMAGALQGITVTPEACAAVLRRLQPAVTGLDGVAAQQARAGAAFSVEAIAAGPSLRTAVADAAAAAGSCPQATVSAAGKGQGTVTLTPLPAPDLGDGAAAVRLQVSVSGPGGVPMTVPALLGAVQDGDRVVTLLSAAPTGTVDEAAFRSLLEAAYRTQADALD